MMMREINNFFDGGYIVNDLLWYNNRGMNFVSVRETALDVFSLGGWLFGCGAS